MKEKVVSAAHLAGLSILNTVGVTFDEWAGRVSVLIAIISGLIVMRYWWFKGNEAKNQSRAGNKPLNTS